MSFYTLKYVNYTFITLPKIVVFCLLFIPSVLSSKRKKKQSGSGWKQALKRFII